MKILCLVLVSLSFAFSAPAQKVYFIYLQTENQSPFYVKMGEKIQSSSSSGYVILSSLVDSVYNFSIGFPSSNEDSRFSVSLGGKDHGFLIRQGDEGWSLFDLQTSVQIKPQKNNSGKNISYQPRNDAFTTLLSKVADDPGLLLVPVVAKEDVAVKEKKKAEKPVENPLPETVRKDTAVTQTQTEATAETKKPESTSLENNTTSVDEKKTNSATETIATTSKQSGVKPSSADSSVGVEVYKRSVIKKHSESSTSEGFGLVYYDAFEGRVDTIRLMIPNPKFVFKLTDSAQAENSNQMLELKREDVPSTSSSSRASCRSVATENDFLKLRRNMAAKISDEGMVDEAKKYFRNKCFSTEQIKNLSTLFLTSAGKYQFFDAAWLHVTDREQFAGLQSEIKDDYYLKRFKSLVGQ